MSLTCCKGFRQIFSPEKRRFNVATSTVKTQRHQRHLTKEGSILPNTASLRTRTQIRTFPRATMASDISDKSKVNIVLCYSSYLAPMKEWLEEILEVTPRVKTQQPLQPNQHTKKACCVEGLTFVLPQPNACCLSGMPSAEILVVHNQVELGLDCHSCNAGSK